MKILLVGDSFAADWNEPAQIAWWQMLGDHSVINAAQAGVGEYKIYQQILGSDLTDIDVVLVCHTSPYRIHAQTNPLHDTGHHANSDLIFSDVESAPNSPVKDHLLFWFREIMDLDHARDMHGLVKEKIFSYLNQQEIGHCHMTFFDTTDELFKLQHEINFHKIWKQHPGHVNHLDPQGNQLVAETLKKVFL